MTLALCGVFLPFFFFSFFACPRSTRPLQSFSFFIGSASLWFSRYLFFPRPPFLLAGAFSRADSLSAPVVSTGSGVFTVLVPAYPCSPLLPPSARAPSLAPRASHRAAAPLWTWSSSFFLLLFEFLSTHSAEFLFPIWIVGRAVPGPMVEPRRGSSPLTPVLF